MTFAVGDVVEVWEPALFTIAEPPPWRPPAAALRDRGVCSADDPRNGSDAHVAVLRAVAEHIALGGWCDAMAWADVVNPFASAASAREVEPEPELFPC